MIHSAQELYDLLNEQDECPWIEAKGGGESTRTVMETVCSFSNEPGLGGGYIVMGIAENDPESALRYKISEVKNPDKFQKDFATQCAGMFNLPVRPEVNVEKINEKTVIKIHVNELPDRQKPVFFIKDGLPGGAYRRIGSTDQRCTEDDMHIFYQDSSSFDQTEVKGSSMADIDEVALERYRQLREKVNPAAEELLLGNLELLQSLGCINKDNAMELNVAGFMLFGSSKAHRKFCPMIRVDYIRVPGNTWVDDPDNRFVSIDMQGPIILVLFRLIDAINVDLPRGFLLQDNKIQAESIGLPLKALREAIVNALMHRSYRANRPTQVIRYDNRIEIINPGFSLKSEEKLGQPGSETRNPFIAAVFHDTNLAETKGSGIRAMRKLMHDAHLVPPTFESSREHNEFTVRLLLHNLLNEEDINWLAQYEHLNLSDSQKLSLIFVREVGAIDNPSYRQMADCDTLRASTDLRVLRANDLLKQKGKGKATYYVPGDALSTPLPEISTLPISVSTQPNVISTQAPSVSTQAFSVSTHAPVVSTQVTGTTTIPPEKTREDLLEDIPEEILSVLQNLKVRENNPEKLMEIIRALCSLRAYKAAELALIVNKREDYIRKKFLNPLIERKEVEYLYPEMIRHPEQAYRTVK
jgi:ATP-dependent DNA helicase RecG